MNSSTDYLFEASRYRDEGCKLSSSCLHCPFPSCLDDVPWGRQRWLRKRRQEEIARLHSQGKSTRELARLFRVSQRTVQRALKSRNEGLTMTTSYPCEEPSLTCHCEGRSPEATRPPSTPNGLLRLRPARQGLAGGPAMAKGARNDAGNPLQTGEGTKEIGTHAL